MRLKIKLLFFVMLVLMRYDMAFAQLEGQARVDSLKKILPGLKDDTVKIKVLDDIAFGAQDPDEGLIVAQQELQLAERLNHQRGVAAACNTMAYLYSCNGQPQKALECSFRSLKICESINNKRGISVALGNISTIYIDKGSYPQALEYSLKALKMNEDMRDSSGIGSVSNNIGNIYDAMGNADKALEYYTIAYDISSKAGEKPCMANSLGNISLIYQHRGAYDKALDYAERAYKLWEELGDKHGMTRNLANMATVYALQNDHIQALEYNYRSLKLSEETGDSTGIAINTGNIGEIYVNIAKDTSGKFFPLRGISEFARADWPAGGLIPKGKAACLKAAIDHLQKALAICRRIEMFDPMQQFYKSLAEAYELAGDYKHATANYKIYYAMKDSAFSKENSDRIVKLEMETVYERKAAAAALRLQRQQTFTYIGLSGVVVLLGFSFFIIRERKKSDRERKKSDELLLNILPAEVASELKQHGNTKARYFENVTVLFTDFVNFTRAGENMHPQSLVDELHTCFKAFDEITNKYKIEKIKTIGDAYLAVSGLPVADEKHAERMVQAAEEIRDYMDDRLGKLGPERTFAVRIGIHSGSAVAGIVGVKKFAYDIWGDTVNTAARMEQHGEPGKINISDTTYELVKHRFTCEYRGEVEAKGKGVMKMYFVS